MLYNNKNPINPIEDALHFHQRIIIFLFELAFFPKCLRVIYLLPAKLKVFKILRSRKASGFVRTATHPERKMFVKLSHMVMQSIFLHGEK